MSSWSNSCCFTAGVVQDRSFCTWPINCGGCIEGTNIGEVYENLIIQRGSEILDTVLFHMKIVFARRIFADAKVKMQNFLKKYFTISVWHPVIFENFMSWLILPTASFRLGRILTSRIFRKPTVEIYNFAKMRFTIVLSVSTLPLQQTNITSQCALERTF